MILRRASVLFLAGLAACGSGGGAPRSFPVEFGDVAAVEAALAAERGHAVLLNVWAMWCPPCVEELPDLAAAVEAQESRGARVVAVSHDMLFTEDPPDAVAAEVRAFLEARGLALPTVLLDPDAVEALDERYELPGFIPVTLALDRDGRVVDRQDGPATRERFDEMLRKALAGGS